MTSPIILLKAWNLKPKKNMGQNFLADPSAAETITARARLSFKDVVVEIGAGLGALTIPLARLVKQVYAVEKDRQLIQLLKNELLANRIANCDVIAKDILQIDLQAIATAAACKITIIGNLPYGISSQILVQLIQSRNAIKRAILMFQKELAQRICARPGGKQYSRISAMLGYCAEIQILANVKASVFYPQPKVDSTVIEIKFKPTYVYGSHNEAMLFKTIKAAFGNRRKTLKNALIASGLDIDSQTVLRALKLAGIDPSRRAETLNPAEFVSLEIGVRKAKEKKGENCL